MRPSFNVQLAGPVEIDLAGRSISLYYVVQQIGWNEGSGTVMGRTVSYMKMMKYRHELATVIIPNRVRTASTAKLNMSVSTRNGIPMTCSASLRPVHSLQGALGR